MLWKDGIFWRDGERWLRENGREVRIAELAPNLERWFRLQHPDSPDWRQMFRGETGGPRD